MPTEYGQWIIESCTRGLILQRRLVRTACAIGLRLYQPPLYADAIHDSSSSPGPKLTQRARNSSSFFFPTKDNELPNMRGKGTMLCSIFQSAPWRSCHLKASVDVVNPSSHTCIHVTKEHTGGQWIQGYHDHLETTNEIEPRMNHSSPVFPASHASPQFRDKILDTRLGGNVLGVLESFDAMRGVLGNCFKAVYFQRLQWRIKWCEKVWWNRRLMPSGIDQTKRLSDLIRWAFWSHVVHGYNISIQRTSCASKRTELSQGT